MNYGSNYFDGSGAHGSPSDSYSQQQKDDETERLRARVAELEVQLEQSRSLGKLGGYPYTPEHTWAEWLEDRHKRVAELENTLKDVAAVAHFGGSVRMMEPEALVVIRKLTIAHSGGLDHGGKSVVARLVKVRGL